MNISIIDLLSISFRFENFTIITFIPISRVCIWTKCCGKILNCCMKCGLNILNALAQLKVHSSEVSDTNTLSTVAVLYSIKIYGLKEFLICYVLPDFIIFC